MNKNLVIGVLAGLLLLSAFWGQMEAGKRKALMKDQETQHQAKAAAVSNRESLEAEVAKQDEVQQQVKTQLESVESKLDALRQENADLKNKAVEQDAALTDQKTKAAEQNAAFVALKAEKEQAVHSASKMQDALIAETQKEIGGQQKKLQELKLQLQDLQQKLTERQVIIEQNQEKFASAAKVIEVEQARLKEHEATQAHLLETHEATQARLLKTQADLETAQTSIEQMKEERAVVVLESETMRAQVIGLERIVEERSAALELTGRELASCKINNTVLISKISEQGDALEGLQEQQSTLAEKFAAKQKQMSGKVDKKLEEEAIQH